jgi:PAS domain-containing protein
VHRQQLAWHATFHDLEVRCLNHEGQAHLYAVSGEARYDDNHQFKGYHGIVRNIGARPRPALSDPEHGDLFRRGFDGIASPVCLLNCYGTVLLANAAWRIFASTRTGIGAGVYEGSNYLAALEAAAAGQKIDAIAIAAGIRQVIAGEREVYRYDCEFPAPAASTGGHWYALCATQAADTDPACVVVALEDRTAHKHAERLLKLELAVAQGLAAAGNVSKGLISVLRAVCESQGWDCGRYFSLDQASGVLRFTECWGIPTAAVDRFLGESRGMVFRADAGLAGRVVQSGQPLWFAEGSRDEIVPPTALAPETGAEGAFVFPVAADDQTVGVLAFTGCGIREPDDRMLRTVQSIGIQLGRFLESQASLESLRRREMRFRKLTELSADWCWEQDSQFRFTQYAGSGPFDGSGILGKTTWELPNVVLADARWDEHKSQLAARWAFCDFPFVVAHADGTVGNYCISGEPTYDDDGTFTGYCGTGLDMTRHT